MEMLLLLISLSLSLFCLIWALGSIVGDLAGAPYVPTSEKLVDEILEAAKLKKDQLFLELGSGDGRIVIRAAERFKVRGVGVEINLLLYLLAWIKAKFKKDLSLQFLWTNFNQVLLTEADVIYFFLTRRGVKNLKSKLEQECKRGCLVISHGFEIPGWEKYLVRKQTRDPFSTYFYRL